MDRAACPQAEYNNEHEQTTSTSNLDKPYKYNGWNTHIISFMYDSKQIYGYKLVWVVTLGKRLEYNYWDVT